MNDALARIDAEIASLEARIEGLRYARSIVAGDTGEGAEKKPEAPAARPAPLGGAVTEERRRMIVALLRTHGPMNVTEVSQMMGIEYGLIRRCIIDHPWFERSPGKGRQPWRLTEAGRAANSPA